jgi:alpha-ketoglutarate-dependent taurine dioxygenase
MVQTLFLRLQGGRIPVALGARLFRARLLVHKVLLLHDQHFTRVEHVAFARRFGPLEDHPVVGGDPDHAGLMPLYKGPDSRQAMRP